ncbi:unnamed protein product [Paramecium sonneborni]|nr:unnamed protein product [Paramecium sonneborni]
MMNEKEQLIKKQQHELENILKQNEEMSKEFNQLVQVHQQFGALNEKHQQFQQKYELLQREYQQRNKEFQEASQQIEFCLQEIQQLKQTNNELQNERQQILEELDVLQQFKYESEKAIEQLKFDNNELSLLLQERQELSGKYHALEIKFQADIEYYEKTIKDMNEKLELSQNTSPNIALEERRLVELHKIYEKLDRLLFHLTSKISNEKPSFKVDVVISQLSGSIEQIEKYFKLSSNRSQQDKFQNSQGSLINDHNKISTMRPSDAEIFKSNDITNIKQIQTQQTVAKRKYFL